MAKRDFRKGAIPYDFIAVPRRLPKSVEWRGLSGRSTKLLFDLASQYSGKNNGRLCPSFEVMKRDHGWTSKDQLIKAKQELLECSFVVQTRKGRAPRTAEWVGLTWWKLDYEKSMEIDPGTWPHLNFLNLHDALIDPNEGRKKPNGTAKPVVRSTDRSTPRIPPTRSAARTDGVP